MTEVKNTYQLTRQLSGKYNRNRKLFKRQYPCFAPFRSMRFSLTGNVLSCCFNRYHILGKYPENNMHDIWFGEKKNEICKSLKNNDFSKGCQVCYHTITTQNFHSAGSLQYDYLPKTNKGYPSMLDFEISNTCNLECIMCNGENSALIRQKREGKPPHHIPYDTNFTDQLDEFIPYLSEARFVGGEPFLTELHYKIWDKIIRINPETNITILTNATVLNDRIKQLIHSGNFNISVSIDSFKKETYETIRPNADFEKVMVNMNYFHDSAKKNKKKFFINVCPIKQNRFEIPDMLAYCNSHQVYIVFHTVYFPALCALWDLKSSEINETIIHYKKFKTAADNSLQQQNTLAFASLIRQLEIWKDNAEIREKQSVILHSENLKKELLQKISLHLNKISGTPDKYTYIENQIDLICSQVNNETISSKALFLLNQIDTERIIAEFEISNEPMLYERFLSLGR